MDSKQDNNSTATFSSTIKGYIFASSSWAVADFCYSWYLQLFSSFLIQQYKSSAPLYWSLSFKLVALLCKKKISHDSKPLFILKE